MYSIQSTHFLQHQLFSNKSEKLEYPYIHRYRYLLQSIYVFRFWIGPKSTL